MQTKAIAPEISKAVLGNPVDQAEQNLAAQGKILRVMVEDGQNLMGTCEMRPNRVNVEVTNGVVTGVLDIG